jgi:hypothetical protein
VAKAVKKAKKAASTASAATAPPPAEGDPKKGAPPGGWLQWNQPSSTTWLAPDPEGDASKSGARISMSTRAWQGNPEPLYSVYRDGKYLGSDTSLEAAQQRAQYREQTRSAANDTLDGKPDGMPLALALTGDERAALRAAARASTPAPRKPAREAPEPAKDAPPPKAAEGALPAPKAAAAAPKLRPGKIPGTAIIRVVTGTNPRRAGTTQHARYEIIIAHNGKTVAEYVAAGGQLDALTYAVQGGHVQLEGV